MALTITQGLTAQQRTFQTVSGNVANVNSAGYSEKYTPIVTDSFGSRGTGVQALAEERLEDPIRTEDVREKVIGVSYLESMQQFHDEISRQLGKPGDKGSLGHILTEVKTAFSTLQASPEGAGNQKNTVDKLNALTKKVNQLAQFSQEQRITAEDNIVDAIKSVNDLLESLDKLNGDIAVAHGRGEATGNMMDKQDLLLKDLSQYLDVTVFRRDNKTVDLTTLQGNALLLRSGPRTLEFAKATSIGPADTAATLSAITINGNPLTDIGSGRLGANLKIRDELFPRLQQEIDEFTVRITNHFNAIHNKGTPYPPPTQLTGTTTFIDPAAETIQMTGTVRLAIVDQSTGVHAFAPIILDYTAGPISINDVVADIDAQLGVNGTAVLTADNQLQITAANPAYGIGLVSNTTPEAVDTTSNRGFSHHFGLNDLFVRDADQIGTAQSFSVHSDILNTPSRLARGTLSLQDPVDEPQALYVGQTETITEILAEFDTRLGFASAGKLSAQNTSATDYANSIYHTLAVDGKNNKQQLEIDSTILIDTEKNLADRTGVNLQKQFEIMLEAQKIYAALSRLLKAEDEMIRELTKI